MERQGFLRYADPRLGPRPDRGWLMYIAREVNPDFSYGRLHDPKFNRRYPYRLQVDCLSGDTRERRFVVHYLERKDELLARQAGAVLARLYWIGRDYLGVGPAKDRFVDVWLSRAGEAGGEAYQGSVYLHAIDEPRAPAEWVRELAHEYAHLTLPEIGPYTAPERWSNGYLGERLYLKWLLADNGHTQLWGACIDAAGYMRYQVAPLRDRFLEEGPLTPDRLRTDARGMDHLIGRLLAIEATHGPAPLREAFAHSTGPRRPQELDPALAAAVRRRGAARELDPEAVIPPQGRENPSYRILMPPGDWRIHVQTEGADALRAALEGAALREADPGRVDAAAWDASVARGLWRRLDLSADEPLQIRSIRATRR
jgi:hypothetical protein